MPKSVWWLAFSLALFTTGNALVLSVAVLVGEQLAKDPIYSTVPLLSQYIGIITASIPMAHFMMKYSRKAGFIIGSIGGLIGALLSITGIYYHNLMLFSFGTYFTGIAIGTAQQYRFAALEEAPINMHARAIGLVMSGGIVAAIIGPTLAVATRQFFADYPFIGPFTALSIIYILAFALLLKIPLKSGMKSKTQSNEKLRSYYQLYSQPLLFLVTIVSALGYGVVVYMVGAIPLSMKQNGFEFASIAFVFQCHILGMFAPSFITGQLIHRFGVKVFFFTAILLLIIALSINLHGNTFYHYLISFVLIGISWNLNLISSTHLLSKTYLSHERAKVQGTNDFLVFSFGALGSITGGVTFYLIGWQNTNLVGIAIAVSILLSAIKLRKYLPMAVLIK
ncbi:MFS transporter [Proteus vulgaris]|uniref:MFS transporter n=1 Tax=Proteus vulgaris TaxID=585 RepID=UPI0018E41C8B|nr:MFS transporter [Proteus vulgaris]MBI6527890.1 MFS transporter [Proteus vulgaris]